MRLLYKNTAALIKMSDRISDYKILNDKRNLLRKIGNVLHKTSIYPRIHIHDRSVVPPATIAIFLYQIEIIMTLWHIQMCFVIQFL